MKDLSFNYPFNPSGQINIRNDFKTLSDEFGRIAPDLYKVINLKSDLPAPKGGAITLADNTTYFFIGDLDLKGDRLVGGTNTCILGPSSENSSITSTGLTTGQPLFKTKHTTPIRHISFKDVDTCLDIDGTVGEDVALDWTGVNFVNIPNIGVIKNSDNFIYSKSAVLNSKGLVFDGSIGTIGIDNCLFSSPASSGNMIELLGTMTVTRRFRIMYSSFIILSTMTGINVNSSATIGAERYILDTVNFSDGGTYLSGMDYLDNESNFSNCIGIVNSVELAEYYMVANATLTSIATKDVPVKIAGTTTANAINQKFTHTDNKVEYTGAISTSFVVTATASFSGGNNKNVSLFIAKNGTIDPASEMRATTDGVGKAESIAIQTIALLETGDYIEIWIENNTDSTDFTVEYLNVIVRNVN